MPKISVVMPVYNSEKYIREAVESILNQTYRDFELLAIYDNGTDDSSPQILKDYARKDDRVKPINIKEERGLVKALNYGIKSAKGEYIARMDADDISLPERLEKEVNFLDENNDISILSTTIKTFGNTEENEKIKVEKWFEREINDENIEKLMLHGTQIAHPTVMMRKEIFKNLLGYDEEFKEAEDYDLWLRALKSGFKFAKLDEKLLNYRMFNESKSNRTNNMEYYVVKAKLDYLNNITKSKKLDYIIWGASNGGIIAYKTIKKIYPNFKLQAYVDKFKSGELNEVKILKPTDIRHINCDYIFIATTPGMEEANSYLKSLGYKFKVDYCYIL